MTCSSATAFVARKFPVVAAAAWIFGVASSALAHPIYTFGGQTQYTNVQTKMCLDVHDAQFVAGNYLDSANCNGTDAQQFVFRADTFYTGSYTIRVKSHPNLCVTDMNPQNSFTGGAIIELQSCSLAVWEFRQGWDWAGSNLVSRYELPDGTPFCVDVLNGDNTDGTPLDTTPCNGTEAQWLWPTHFSVELFASNSLECLAAGKSRSELQQCGSRLSAQEFVMTEFNTLKLKNGKRCLVYTAGATPDLALGDCSSEGGVFFAGQQWPSLLPAVGHEFLWMFLSPENVFVDGQPGCIDVYANQDVANNPVEVAPCNKTTAQYWFPSYLSLPR